MYEFQFKIMQFITYEITHNLAYEESQANNVVFESRDKKYFSFLYKKVLMCCDSFYFHIKYVQHKIIFHYTVPI